jgi:SRSO17 transposase
VGAFLTGLMAGLPRTNCWSIAEHAGEARPDGMQRLLACARWDAEAVRDDLRRYVIDHLGHQDAVLVIDETGQVKKGSATVGVQQQYTGTAGRIENAQVAVYLVYAAPAGAAFIDRALYLPRSWTSDPDRCAAAGIPEHVQFATKPALAGVMIEQAVDAGASMPPEPAPIPRRKRSHPGTNRPTTPWAAPAVGSPRRSIWGASRDVGRCRWC